MGKPVLKWKFINYLGMDRIVGLGFIKTAVFLREQSSIQSGILDQLCESIIHDHELIVQKSNANSQANTAKSSPDRPTSKAVTVEFDDKSPLGGKYFIDLVLPLFRGYKFVGLSSHSHGNIFSIPSWKIRH